MADAPGYEAAFASSKGPELWVMLLEKAYAKFIGARGVGYQVWRGGTRSACLFLHFVLRPGAVVNRVPGTVFAGLEFASAPALLFWSPLFRPATCCPPRRR
jgi:hypothetical protein